MSKILVVDDQEDIVRAIEIYLQGEEYEVYKAFNGQEALEIFEREQIDLCLVDVMMPVMDGIELTRRLREQSPVPIIILSAKDEVQDRVLGLNVGADDYVTKPFDAVELLARIKSNLRRSQLWETSDKDKDTYQTKRIQLNDRKKEVYIDGDLVKLTPYEYGILLLLIKNKGQVFTSEEIYEQVWQAPAYDVRKIVSVHISRLRNKIEINPRKPDQVQSIYGMGYKLDENS